jgi:hypothetical protein
MHDHLQVSERNVDAVSGTLVRLMSYRAAVAAVDGAWWPQSRTLVSELPDLLLSLGDRLGSLVGVGYRRDDWTDTPAQIVLDDRVVDLLGFDSAEAPSVILIGHDGHHLTLHVVAPETSERDARSALDAIPEGQADPEGGAQAARTGRFMADVAQQLAAHEGREDDERTAQIRRWCDEAATQFETARVQSFVPILVEHIVHNRMRVSGAIEAPRSH